MRQERQRSRGFEETQNRILRQFRRPQQQRQQKDIGGRSDQQAFRIGRCRLETFHPADLHSHAGRPVQEVDPGQASVRPWRSARWGGRRTDRRRHRRLFVQRHHELSERRGSVSNQGMQGYPDHQGAGHQANER